MAEGRKRGWRTFLPEFKFTTEVKIARPDAADAKVKEACVLIAQAILDTYGVRVRVISDWNDATGPEIIVGECTHRDVAMSFTDSFYKNGYGYKVEVNDAYPTLVKSALEALTGKDIELYQLAINNLQLEASVGCIPLGFRIAVGSGLDIVVTAVAQAVSISSAGQNVLTVGQGNDAAVPAIHHGLCVLGGQRINSLAAGNGSDIADGIQPLR